jgi:tetratricopeptide (TPR) repeat protein
LQDVAKRQPDNPDVYYLLGMAYSKKGDHAKAVEAINQGMKNNPRNTSLFIALGHEYRATKQYELAIEQYQKAIKADKEQGVEGYMFIADVYYTGTNDTRNAEKFYQKYIEAGGQNPKARAMLQRMQESKK